jgi:hypothetical protein
MAFIDRLCGQVVRVLGYRSRGPGSIPGATRFYEKKWVWNGVHSASRVQLRSYLEEKLAAPVKKTIRHADHQAPLYPLKLALTSPTTGGCSVSIVCPRTKAMELLLTAFIRPTYQSPSSEANNKYYIFHKTTFTRPGLCLEPDQSSSLPHLQFILSCYLGIGPQCDFRFLN